MFYVFSVLILVFNQLFEEGGMFDIHKFCGNIFLDQILSPIYFPDYDMDYWLYFDDNVTLYYIFYLLYVARFQLGPQ